MLGSEKYYPTLVRTGQVMSGQIKFMWSSWIICVLITITQSRTPVCFTNISASENRRKMVMQSKFTYGSQLFGEKKYLKICHLVAKILSKNHVSFFGRTGQVRAGHFRAGHVQAGQVKTQLFFTHIFVDPHFFVKNCKKKNLTQNLFCTPKFLYEQKKS